MSKQTAFLSSKGNYTSFTVGDDVALALADGVVSVPGRQNEQTVLLEDFWTRLARVLLA